MVIINVKQLRMAKGMTQRQLAAEANVSKSQLGRIENNESIPTIDTLCDIANALGVPVTDTFEYHHTEKPQP